MTDKVTPTQADRAICGKILGIAGAKVTMGQMQQIDNLIARHASQARAEGLAEGKLIGARLGLEAAADVVLDNPWKPYSAIRALSADVVKGN